MAKKRKGEMCVCILCLQIEPASKEHLIPKSIGGNLTDYRMCVRCNTSLPNNIDQRIGESALLTLSRVGTTTNFDVKLGGEQIGELPDGKNQPVRVGNQFKTTLYPTIRFVLRDYDKMVRIETRLAANSGDANRLMRFVARHKVSNFESLHIKTVEWLERDEAALIMDRRDDGYLAIGADNLLPAALDFIRKHTSALVEPLDKELPPSQYIGGLKIDATSEIPFDDLFRGIAKMAFGLLANRTETPVVLDSRYDELRSYILGCDVRTDKSRNPQWDDRFVSMSSDSRKCVYRDYQHTIVLFQTREFVSAIMTLYRSHVFVVRMPSPSTALWAGIPQIVVSKGDRSDSRWLMVHELGEIEWTS